MSILIKNGTILNSSDIYRGDVFIDGDKVATIGTNLTMEADRVIDATGKMLSFNASAVRQFGYSADEVIGSNVSMLMPNPDRDRHDSYLRRYLETNEPHIIGIGRIRRNFGAAKQTLANFDKEFPHWKGRGYEIAGFFWWQGHKDTGSALHAERYEQNLVRLINALRAETWIGVSGCCARADVRLLARRARANACDRHQVLRDRRPGLRSLPMISCV